MNNSREMMVDHYFNGMLKVAMYTILPLIGLVSWVIGVPILLYGSVMSNLDSAQNAFQVLFIFSLPMFLFLTLLPIVMQKIKRTTWTDLGMVFQSNRKNVILLIANIGIAVYALYRVMASGGQWQMTIPLIIQLCVIGISEEVICRGVIYYELKKIVNKEIFCIIVSSLLFAFVFHSGDSDSANLLYRLPLGFALGCARGYTGSIYNSVLMHIWYNSLVITM